jgi:hypothetical protein
MAEGVITRRVLQKHFSGYDTEGSGRYSLTAPDRAALDEHLAK